LLAHGHTSHRPSAPQQFPAVQSLFDLHPTVVPVEQAPQLPALQHLPAPHSAFVWQRHWPHLRVEESQH
jgi:hypothetical protein